MSTVFADRETGEIQDVKATATEAATALLEEVWRDTSAAYNLAPLTALAVAQKIANAVLAGAVKEHADILAEPFKPQQTRMPL
jgi:hypothetical protein